MHRRSCCCCCTPDLLRASNGTTAAASSSYSTVAVVVVNNAFPLVCFVCFPTTHTHTRPPARQTFIFIFVVRFFFILFVSSLFRLCTTTHTQASAACIISDRCATRVRRARNRTCTARRHQKLSAISRRRRARTKSHTNLHTSRAHSCCVCCVQTIIIDPSSLLRTAHTKPPWPIFC